MRSEARCGRLCSRRKWFALGNSYLRILAPIFKIRPKPLFSSGYIFILQMGGWFLGDHQMKRSVLMKIQLKEMFELFFLCGKNIKQSKTAVSSSGTGQNAQKRGFGIYRFVNLPFGVITPLRQVFPFEVAAQSSMSLKKFSTALLGSR